MPEPLCAAAFAVLMAAVAMLDLIGVIAIFAPEKGARTPTHSRKELEEIQRQMALEDLRRRHR